MPKRRPGDSRPAAQPDHHARMQRDFRWHVPARFNIADACSRRWADLPDASERIAIREHGAGADDHLYSFHELQVAADRLSQALAGAGIGRGERVAIVLPQRFETAVAYIALLQMGAVALPLSVLFGPEALEHRLADSGAICALCDAAAIDHLLAVRARCPALRRIVGIGPAGNRADVAYHDFVAERSPPFEPVGTSADDGAVLIYTSGTTGPPKGALIPHRALIGNLPGFVCSQNWFGFDPALSTLGASGGTHPAGQNRSAAQTGSGARVDPHRARAGERHGDAPVFWSPADWAWTGGLMDALLPTLYFGRAIVACRERFSPDLAFEIMQRHRVTHTFLFPTALKAMMKACPQPRARYDLKLEAIMSAGEAVGDAVFDWCTRELAVTCNEMFGQTELNYVVGNCAMNGRSDVNVGWPARAGSMGRPYPGHRIALLDEEGNECAAGESGDVAVCRHDLHGDADPIFFLGYWNDAAATRAKYVTDAHGNEWCRTGDLALRDADGYLWYQGRADDVFKVAGYRIGPSEIENCLVKHPAVANAAVVPKPDPERGALVKAYIVLAPDFLAQSGRPEHDEDALRANLVVELQAHVKSRLAPYEYPKEIEFIDALPMTTTGKVQRRVLRLQEERRADQEREAGSR